MAIVMIDSVLGERSDEVGMARDFRLERLYLRGRLTDSSNGWCCYFNDLVRHVREVGGVVCRGKNDARVSNMENEVPRVGSLTIVGCLPP